MTGQNMQHVTPWLQKLLRLGEQERIAFADKLLEEKIQTVQNNDQDLLDILFLKAIKHKLDGTGTERQHIYLEQSSIPQIVLFDILVHKMPFVVQGHRLVNEEIALILEEKEHAVLIDVGTGHGLQMVRLLDRLQKNQNLRHLTIIAIEPFAEALRSARQSIETAAAAMHFQVHLHTLENLIETVDPEEIEAFLPEQRDVMIVNSAFTLHHILRSGSRQQFFRQMHDFQADYIFLLEPHSGHFTDDWQERVINAYTHYGAVFRVIDQLDITEQERKGLKLFFGREIDDVAGESDHQRFERHEEGCRWLRYMEQSGFAAAVFTRVPADLPRPSIQFVTDERNYLRMIHDNITILSVIKGVRK